MTMVTNFFLFFFICKHFLTNIAFHCNIMFFYLLFGQNHSSSVECFHIFIYFFFVFKQCLKELIYTVFTTKHFKWFRILIICRTNNFISIGTSFMFLCM